MNSIRLKGPFDLIKLFFQKLGIVQDNENTYISQRGFGRTSFTDQAGIRYDFFYNQFDTGCNLSLYFSSNKMPGMNLPGMSYANQDKRDAETLWNEIKKNLHLLPPSAKTAAPTKPLQSIVEKRTVNTATAPIVSPRGPASQLVQKVPPPATKDKDHVSSTPPALENFFRSLHQFFNYMFNQKPLKKDRAIEMTTLTTCSRNSSAKPS